jgi:hypothetical protein
MEICVEFVDCFFLLRKYIYIYKYKKNAYAMPIRPSVAHSYKQLILS